jgi:hypothetical protein
MRLQLIHPMILGAALTAAAAPCAAEDLTAFSACRAERDDARRLACYDRETDRLTAGQSATTAPAETKIPEERFGYQGALAREEHDRDREEARGLGELVATVTEISTRADGTLVMTFDNGQVWRQNRPDAFFRLKVGEQVKIEPAAMHSFLLSGPSKRSTRVTRVR